MGIGYLDTLDKLFRAGTAQLSSSFVDIQVRFVEESQLPDGGFTGRKGDGDLYYTDFGARVLTLLPSGSEWAKKACRYLQSQKDSRDVIDCFGALNVARMLRQQGVDMPIDKVGLVERLRAQDLGRGFARPGGKEVSAYTTFLAALCFEMLETSFPNPGDAVAAISILKCQDGGYSESPGHPVGQTNATAAAIAFLMMQDALAEEDAQSAARFLANMQAPDGGILAQSSAVESDLLSTFTGCLTLLGLDALDQIDTAAVARLVGQLAARGGGFRACISDDEPDVEYTYYGLGTFAVLRTYVLATQV
ncbi:MAG: terpene cyclase/mutase family protein [Armatimonadetes bacterium]|nr:terpene cyclase/mutase family protein [Armatimonadota bacterium]